METVIPPGKADGHVIRKYQFKVLSQGMEESDTPSEEGGPVPYTFQSLDEPAPAAEASPKMEEDTERPAEEEEGETPELAPYDETFQAMLEKADKLSSELIRLEMELEKEREAFEKALSEAREEAYQKGVEEGRESCTHSLGEEVEALKKRLAESIEALDRSRQQFLEKVDSIEGELIETAIDLARQVVAKEIQRDSKEVALRLAKLLLTEVKEASTVTLKVSPEDYDFLKTRLVSNQVEIVSDPAVAPGGVVILSDVGNIDGQIMHRFERIKEAVFGTVG